MSTCNRLLIIILLYAGAGHILNAELNYKQFDRMLDITTQRNKEANQRSPQKEQKTKQLKAMLQKQKQEDEKNLSDLLKIEISLIRITANNMSKSVDKFINSIPKLDKNCKIELINKHLEKFLAHAPLIEIPEIAKSISEYNELEKLNKDVSLDKNALTVTQETCFPIYEKLLTSMREINDYLKQQTDKPEAKDVVNNFLAVIESVNKFESILPSIKENRKKELSKSLNYELGMIQVGCTKFNTEFAGLIKLLVEPFNIQSINNYLKKIHFIKLTSDSITKYNNIFKELEKLDKDVPLDKNALANTQKACLSIYEKLVASMQKIKDYLNTQTDKPGAKNVVNKFGEVGEFVEIIKSFAPEKKD